MPYIWGFELFNYVSTSAIVLLVSNVLLAVFFLFVYRQKRQEYLLAWSGAWLLTSFHFLSSHFDPAGSHSWFEALDEWLLVAAALAFCVAARIYARLTVATNAVIGAAAFAALWACAYIYGYWGVPASLGAALIFFVVAHIFWKEGRKQESRADLFLGVTFGAWALICVAIAFRRRLGFLQADDLLALTWLPQLFAGVLMVMAVYE